MTRPFRLIGAILVSAVLVFVLNRYLPLAFGWILIRGLFVGVIIGILFNFDRFRRM